jgi:hypothetical protein
MLQTRWDAEAWSVVRVRADSGTVGTVLDVVENRPRWILVDWHTPPDTCINPLFENEEFLTLAAGDGRDSQRRGRAACHCE